MGGFSPGSLAEELFKVWLQHSQRLDTLESSVMISSGLVVTEGIAGPDISRVVSHHWSCSERLVSGRLGLVCLTVETHNLHQPPTHTSLRPALPTYDNITIAD